MAALFLSSAIRKRIDRVAALRRARWGVEAGLLGLFWRVCASARAALGVRFRPPLLGAVGPRLGKSAHVRRNLRRRFPISASASAPLFWRGIGRYAGAVLGEYPHFKAICHDDFDGHFEFVEKRTWTTTAPARGHGVFVSAHIGNWELCAAAAGRQGIPITVIYAPSRNPSIDRMLRRPARGARLPAGEPGRRRAPFAP